MGVRRLKKSRPPAQSCSSTVFVLRTHLEGRGAIASDPFVGMGNPPWPCAAAIDVTHPGNGSCGGQSDAKSAAASPKPTGGPDDGDPPHQQLNQRKLTLPGCSRPSPGPTRTPGWVQGPLEPIGQWFAFVPRPGLSAEVCRNEPPAQGRGLRFRHVLQLRRSTRPRPPGDLVAGLDCACRWSRTTTGGCRWSRTDNRRLPMVRRMTTGGCRWSRTTTGGCRSSRTPRRAVADGRAP